jgi:acetyltransferase-like isoleucine patch superfamily enzyme
MTLGKRIFVGDRVLIYEDHGGGEIELQTGVHLHNDIYLQTGEGGKIKIGKGTHIQPRCQLSAYKGAIQIGERVEIAPNCAFYPYDHSMEPDRPLSQQPLRSRGGIVIEDDVWLGFGVIVLDGVTIGKDAVVGAGSVVNKDVPAGAIAVGVPARVMKNRFEVS